MRLVAYDLNKVERPRAFKRTKLLALLEDFAERDLECVEVVDYNHVNAFSCAASLQKAIVRYNIGGVAAISRKGKVFLIKTSSL